jgi:23S rRNA (guanosine2251-2'-O)-methyltransferase
MMAGSEQQGARPRRYIYGVNPVSEAIRSRAGEIERLYVVEGSATSRPAAELLGRARSLGIEVEQVGRDRVAAMTQGGVHQGLVAQLRGFEYAQLEDLLARAQAGQSDRPLLLVVLDGVQDPQNLGAVIRSSYALGAHGVVIPKDRSAQVTAAVVKASAGATELCPVAQVVNLSRSIEAIKTAGAWIVAADPTSKDSLWKAKLSGPLAIVVGGEASGIRPGVLKHCDLRLSIPMVGRIGSLNASVATAIILSEIDRCRRHAAGT